MAYCCTAGPVVQVLDSSHGHVVSVTVRSDIWVYAQKVSDHSGIYWARNRDL